MLENREQTAQMEIQLMNVVRLHPKTKTTERKQNVLHTRMVHKKYLACECESMDSAAHLPVPKNTEYRCLRSKWKENNTEIGN